MEKKQLRKKKNEKTGFSIAADHGAQHSLSSNLVRVTAAIASSKYHQWTNTKTNSISDSPKHTFWQAELSFYDTLEAMRQKKKIKYVIK